MSEIQGRVAFVTGGASGLGLSMARILLRRSASVMLADRDAEGLERAVAELSQDSNAVSSVVCDVAEAGAIEEAAQKTVEHFGKVHIVANNAGVGLGGQPGEIPIEDWRWIVDINLMGVVSAAKISAHLFSSVADTSALYVSIPSSREKASRRAPLTAATPGAESPRSSLSVTTRWAAESIRLLAISGLGTLSVAIMSAGSISTRTVPW